MAVSLRCFCLFTRNYENPISLNKALEYFFTPCSKPLSAHYPKRLSPFLNLFQGTWARQKVPAYTVSNFFLDLLERRCVLGRLQREVTDT